MPHVSVVIPTYNRLSFLQEAVASCLKGNADLEVEVVVVDDGSTDGTRDWLRGREDGRIRPVLREHEGAQRARNAGLEAAQGDTIKFLDSDDYLYSGVLEEEYELLMESKADVCYGPIDVVGEDGEVLGHKLNPPVENLLGGIAAGRVTTYPHVFLYRAEVARREQWRPDVPYHQDTVYALDVAAHDLRTTRVKMEVGAHRVHDEERIANVKSDACVEERIKRKFYYIVNSFKQAENVCENNDIRDNIAYGAWMEAHKMAPYNLLEFISMYGKILKIKPNFYPERENFMLSAIDRMVSPVITEVIVNPFRMVRNRG